MASQRFRSLERGPDAPDAQLPASGEGAEPGIAARARSLEREGELQLDESRVIATHVCRACHFENRAELVRCLNCGTPLGGADQEAFDREVRASHAHHLADRHEATTHPPAQPAATSLEPATERPQAQGDADEIGMGAVLATGFITASIFALVSIPVRFIFSRAFGGPFSFRSCAELVLVVAVTGVVYAVYGRQLRRL
ncbi:MAG TPA: hypothetical protein DEP35_00555 [Deltaproteobacteria bacterium]|nr:hypothetical protein [Deltaproteobacteria bacterium]